VRLNTLLLQLLGLEYLRIIDATFGETGLVVDVAPTWRAARCSSCGFNGPCYDRDKGRRWRHLDACGMTVHLRYDTRRVDCVRCGVTVEHVPWANPSAWFTRPFEDQVGYLAQRCDRTTVSKQMRVNWSTVDAIITRVVRRHTHVDPLANLTLIGIDELSYRKHHEYITTVVDHVTGKIVWAHRGKSADTLKLFFAELGAKRVAKIKAVTIDMSAAYVKAVTEAAPNAEIIYDRFHVQRLVHDALDEVRRAEVHEAPTAEDREALKGTRYPTQKRPWNMTDVETKKLTTLPFTNFRLYIAYLMKESLAALLDSRQVHVVRAKLVEWIAWAGASQLAPFVRAAKTIASHIEGILAYVRSRLTNARTEGLNGKIRTITRRSYGLHSASSLITLLKLCCSHIELEPVTLRPGSTH